MPLVFWSFHFCSFFFLNFFKTYIFWFAFWSVSVFVLVFPLRIFPSDFCRLVFIFIFIFYIDLLLLFLLFRFYFVSFGFLPFRFDQVSSVLVLVNPALFVCLFFFINTYFFLFFSIRSFSSNLFHFSCRFEGDFLSSDIFWWEKYSVLLYHFACVFC